MHRSASTTRASEEFFIHGSSPSSKASPGMRTVDSDELPTYDPLSDFAKKERQRLRFAEHAIHLIPLVLVLCAVILWFFSNPEVDMKNNYSSIAARIEGLTIDGDIEVTGSETGLLEPDDLDPPKQMPNRKIF